MCGILGYVGERNGIPLVHEGLKSLSYRGYDSWGLAAHDNGTILVEKQVGDISKVSELTVKSQQVIAQTRWATHGGVTIENAHPHINSEKTISVVHNGIIENFHELKKELEKEGYEFLSETDTEVIPHLIDFYMKQGRKFEEAFVCALKRFQGSYAILATHKDVEGLMFAREGSPLVIGVGEKEHFISSDIPSFLSHTKTILLLEDGDYGIVNGKIDVYNNGTSVNRTSSTADWDVEVVKKGSYPHFMLKEVFEQPLTVRKALNQKSELVSRAKFLLQNASTVFLVGCGTSYNTCATATYQFSKAGKQSIAILGSEFDKHLPFIDDKNVLVAVSQSGETADVLDAVKSAKKKNVKIISIVNVPSSTLARISDVVIPMNSGPELCVLSTKTCTAQLGILYTLALALQGKSNAVLKKSADKALDILKKQDKRMQKLAKKLTKAKSMFCIGRNEMSQIAREAALKIKEVSYIHAEGMAAGELKHGSIALIEKDLPVIVFSDDNTRELTTSNAMEVKARGAYVIGVDTKDNPAYDYFIQLPEKADPHLLSLLPIQLLSYYLAVERGCDPDHPRNLAKCISVR